jgi:hypothetical protein
MRSQCVRAARKSSATTPSFAPRRTGADDGLRARRRPGLKRDKAGQQVLQVDTPCAGQNFLGLRIHLKRPGREQEGGAVEEFDQRLGALF